MIVLIAILCVTKSAVSLDDEIIVKEIISANSTIVIAEMFHEKPALGNNVGSIIVKEVHKKLYMVFTIIVVVSLVVPFVSILQHRYRPATDVVYVTMV